MRMPDLDKILSAMLQTYDGISDLNFSVGHPLQVEDFRRAQAGLDRSADRQPYSLSDRANRAHA